MAIIYDGNKAVFESVIYEDEVVEFRDFLQANAGDEINLNLEGCEDVHLAIIQLILAYEQNYTIYYEYGEKETIFKKILKGFDTSEDDCN